MESLVSIASVTLHMSRVTLYFKIYFINNALYGANNILHAILQMV